jgi:hypothetical protein
MDGRQDKKESDMSDKESLGWLTGLRRPMMRFIRKTRSLLWKAVMVEGQNEPHEDARISAQAQELNKTLMADIQAVTEDDWLRFEKQILNYCVQREFLPDYTEGWLQSRYRLYFMVKWLEKVIQPDAAGLVGLEMGGITPATDLLNHYFTNVKWLNTTGDLRYPWKQASDSTDVLVCTELLEHVSDLPDGFDDSFMATGLKAVLLESFRVLKPGGVMLVSTPNGGSIFQLEKTLHSFSPWFYTYHIREYTLNEMFSALQSAGFQIKESKAIHCLTPGYHSDYTSIFHMLLKYGFSTADRGDDLFIIATKPEV